MSLRASTKPRRAVDRHGVTVCRDCPSGSSLQNRRVMRRGATSAISENGMQALHANRCAAPTRHAAIVHCAIEAAKRGPGASGAGRCARNVALQAALLSYCGVWTADVRLCSVHHHTIPRHVHAALCAAMHNSQRVRAAGGAPIVHPLASHRVCTPAHGSDAWHGSRCRGDPTGAAAWG
jgi:hypothetical protein